MKLRKRIGNRSSKVGRKPTQEQHVADEANERSRQRYPDEESGGVHGALLIMAFSIQGGVWATMRIH